MENEEWKEIEGYDGYQISSCGRIKSFKNNIESILKQSKNNRGYYVVNLTKKNIKKTLTVHRLVGTSFIPNPENKPDINHKNGIKTDNNVTNLEWATAKQNTQHAYNTGLMKNTRKASKKNAIIASESRKIPIYSKKLDLKFNSIVEAATYLKTYYFENITLGCLQSNICKLLLNQITKSKYDFGWEYIK